MHGSSIQLVALAASLIACGSLPPEPKPDASFDETPDTTSIDSPDGYSVNAQPHCDALGAADAATALQSNMKCFAPGVYVVPDHTALASAGSNVKFHAHFTPGFCLDKLEVTRGDWASCVSAGKCQPTCAATCKGAKDSTLCESCAGGTPKCNEKLRFYCGSDPNAVNAAKFDAGSAPLRHVTVGEALWFCKQMRPGGRLPTATEWLIAAWNNGPCTTAHDGSTTCQGKWERYPWGTAWPPPMGTANLHKSVGVDNSDGLASVGTYGDKTNTVKDLVGNVRELLWQFSIECSGCPTTSIHARAFGGSFESQSAAAVFSHVTVTNASWHAEDVGFRCATDSWGP